MEKPIKMKLKKGDHVVVIAGKEKGKTGEIAKVSPATNKVVVAGLNMIKKATKPNQQTGEGGGHHRQGGPHPRLQRHAGGPQDPEAHPQARPSQDFRAFPFHSRFRERMSVPPTCRWRNPVGAPRPLTTEVGRKQAGPPSQALPLSRTLGT